MKCCRGADYSVILSLLHKPEPKKTQPNKMKIQLVFLLAGAAICASTPVPRCRCTKKDTEVDIKLVVSMITKAGNQFCHVPEVLVKLKTRNGFKEVCVEHNGKVHKLLESLKKRPNMVLKRTSAATASSPESTIASGSTRSTSTLLQDKTR
ncbi:unnamed protein product [Knipowitschia caucasica]|uniref:Chemokine interleukin-8-like domain-containing protein n=1 Tax=Knipowitschia caucasica TaxID=637954 RepID=A0AAV2KQS6_KNICA